MDWSQDFSMKLIAMTRQLSVFTRPIPQNRFFTETGQVCQRQKYHQPCLLIIILFVINFWINNYAVRAARIIKFTRDVILFGAISLVDNNSCCGNCCRERISILHWHGFVYEAHRPHRQIRGWSRSPRNITTCQDVAIWSFLNGFVCEPHRLLIDITDNA